MDDRHDLPLDGVPPEGEHSDETGADRELDRDERVEFGPPHPGRARIAGVEAGVAAGLTPPDPAQVRPGGDRGGRAGERGSDDEWEGDATQAMSVPLPAWTDPPTREVPRVLLNSADEPTSAVPGPVWREDENDWDSDSLAFAELVNEGSAVSERPLGPRNDDLELPPYGSTRRPPQPDQSHPLPPRTISSNPVARSAVPDARVAGGTQSHSELESRSAALGATGAEASDLPEADGGARSGHPRHRRSGVVWAGRRQEETDDADVAVPPADTVSGDDAGPQAEELVRTSAMRVPDRGRRLGPRVRLLFAGHERKVAGGVSTTDRAPETEAPFDAVEAEGAGAKSSRRNPVVATLTGLALGGIALACFFAGAAAVLALACIVFMIAVAEAYQGFRRAHYRPAVVLGLLATPAAAVAGYFRGTQGVLLVVAAFVVLSFCWYLAGVTRHRRVANLGVTILGWLWIGGLGSFVGVLLRPTAFPHRHGIAFVLGALEAVVAYDVGAYLFGSLLGEHSLAPSISPNKTWEGLLGGSLCALVVAIAITRLMAPWTLGRAIALGVVVAILAPLGDLAESMVKRELGLKDMGTLLPAHGGLLDRIDAILFVLPATYYLVLTFHR